LVLLREGITGGTGAGEGGGRREEEGKWKERMEERGGRRREK
jgi:hypothetical protein